MSENILVITEHLQGHVLDITYVMLAGARKLAEQTGGKVIAVLLGYKAQPLARNFRYRLPSVRGQKKRWVSGGVCLAASQTRARASSSVSATPWPGMPMMK